MENWIAWSDMNLCTKKMLSSLCYDEELVTDTYRRTILELASNHTRKGIDHLLGVCIDIDDLDGVNRFLDVAEAYKKIAAFTDALMYKSYMKAVEDGYAEEARKKIEEEQRVNLQSSKEMGDFLEGFMKQVEDSLEKCKNNEDKEK